MSVDTLGVVTGTTSTEYSIQEMQEAIAAALKEYSATNTTVMSSTSGTTTTDSTTTSSDVPDLDTPITISSGFSGLSLENLVTAIGNTERKQACAEGVDRLERRAEKISENNQLKLEQMAENLETMKKQETLSGFSKAFQWIGAVVGLVASAVTIAVGAATGNPLIVAAGVIGFGMALDTTVSLATDGEHSMSQGITKLAEKCGASEDTAQWIAFGVQMALTLTSVFLSFGAAGGSLASSASSMSTTAMSNINKVQAAGQIISGLNNMAMGATSTAAAVFDYQIAMNEAESVDIDAILERIRAAQDFEEAMIQAEMERSNDLLGSVNDIIDNSNQTAMTIMSSAPTMA